jgi:hypothetical protein
MFGNFLILDIYSFHSVQLWLGGLESLEIFSSPMLRPNFFPPTQQGGGMIGSCYTLQATDNFSRHQCNNLGLSVFETEAQHELSMTPDHSIKECAKRKSYIKENYQVGKQ